MHAAAAACGTYGAAPGTFAAAILLDMISTACGLEAVEWRYRSAPCRALDFSFVVRSTDADLGRRVERLFAPFVTDDEPRYEYSIVARGAPGDMIDLYENGALVERAHTVVEHLMWRVNRHVVESSGRYLLLHAAAAQLDDAGVILPGPSGSGKTTLVAGLVRAGLAYITDEAAALDPRSGLLEPYPKALAVEPGSWDVLSDLEPDDAAERDVALATTTQWLVEPASIRVDAIGTPCRTRLVIAPTYDPDAATELRPISRAEGVALLVENSFNFARHGRPGLELLVEAVRDADCYRLRFRDLDDACGEIVRMLGKRAAS
jgi:hypothetical protein